MKGSKRLALSAPLLELLGGLCGTTQANWLKQLARDVHALSGQYVFACPEVRRGTLDPARQAQVYLAYYLPVNLIKLHPILDEIAPLGIFQQEHLSVLDLGCGPGTAALGVLEYLAAHALPGLQRITIRGIDRMAENVALARQLVSAYRRSGSLPGALDWDIRFEQGSITSPADIDRLVSPIRAFSLIVAGNVVTELSPEGFGTLAACLRSRLAPEGAGILLDPGTCRSAKKLYRLREAILETTPLHLYAPCLRAGGCPLEHEPAGWCHEKVFWDPPPLVQAVDRHTGFSKTKGVTYSYYTFVGYPASLAEQLPGHAPDALWRVVSYRMRNKGEDRLYVCNGMQRRLLRRLARNADDGNREFTRARRGDIVHVADVLPRHAFWEVTRESRFRIVRPSLGGADSER
jgi:SAM-dependent methyltransferase